MINSLKWIPSLTQHLILSKTITGRNMSSQLTKDKYQNALRMNMTSIRNNKMIKAQAMINSQISITLEALLAQITLI